MKYSLATLSAALLSAVTVPVVQAQPPVCDLEVDDLPIPSHASANMAAGQVNGKSTMTVCTNPGSSGRAKAFSIVSSTDFGPAGGQPNESWSGRAEDGSELTVVVDARGHATASITDLPRKTVTDVYRDAQGNSQSVTRSVNDYPDEADPEDVGGGGVDLTVGMDDLNRRALRGGDVGATTKEDGPRRRLLDDGSQLDVLVLWTEFAECRNSGLARGCAPTATTEANIRNRINLAFAETNDAYTDSGVNTQINLVHAQKTIYDDSVSFSTSLSDLQMNGDGKMDEAHTLREQYKADLIALIIDDPAYCGMAYLGPSKNYMFSVTAWNCATGYYSFGHEIGHNLGCNHDKGTTNACTSSAYDYGWRDPNANFRSILAYNCVSGQCDNNAGGGCTRVKMFSNPNFKYNDQAIGDAGHDNARQINDVRLAVSQYYDSATGCTVNSDCDDGISCTDDVCSAGVCSNTPNDARCSDSNACTTNEFCSATLDCQSTPVTCNDNNPCTEDTCDPSAGCLFLSAPMEGASCNDGSTCTSDDKCSGGECVGNPLANCNCDGFCDTAAGENCSTCPSDCASGTTSGGGCGNGICEAGNGETCTTCPQDCNGITGGKPSNRYCCGANEGCGDSRCGDSCTVDPVASVEYCCGDGICNGPETWQTCGDCDEPAPTPAPVTPPPVACGNTGAPCSSNADCCGKCNNKGKNPSNTCA